MEIIISDRNEERALRSAGYVYEKVSELPFRSYRPYELPKIQRQHRYRILILDKDLIDMLDRTHQIVDEYLSRPNMSHLKVDIDPLYLE